MVGWKRSGGAAAAAAARGIDALGFSFLVRIFRSPRLKEIHKVKKSCPLLESGKVVNSGISCFP